MMDLPASALQGKAPEVEVEAEPTEVLGPLSKPDYYGHVGFIEVMFTQWDMPPPGGPPGLGLVMDWSMPFPVIAKVLPNSLASTRSQLKPGLVLAATNKSGVRIKLPREEMEEKLRRRPLHLIFSDPAPERFDYFGTMKLWKRHLNKALTKPWLGQQGMVASSMTIDWRGQNGPQGSVTMGSLGASMGAMNMQSFLGQAGLPNATANFSRSLNRANSLPGFDSMHGARVPELRAMRETMKLPMVIRGNTMNASIWGSDANQRSTPRKIGSAGYSSSSTLGGSFPRMAARRPKADLAYQHLIDDPRPTGPGAPENWPLHHNDMYICRLSDMMLAWRLREAYEVGFRGYKYERPKQMHLICGKGAPILQKRVARCDDVYCDMCGNDITVEKDVDKGAYVDPVELLMNPGLAKPKVRGKTTEEINAEGGKFDYNLQGGVKASAGAFYFCRRCKREAQRFELCAACHAVEVIQSEGKHRGKELHPHYLQCQHKSMVQRRFVSDAVPGMAHIRRVMCDYCGHVAGSHDSDSEIWVCPSCPESHGLRFEMCSPCHKTLMTVSQGVDRIYSGANL